MNESNARKMTTVRDTLEKTPTGIIGLDEITDGGLPKGRPTLVCGGTGCGKTLLAMEFLVHGALQFDEPGVFMSFEEKAEDLEANFASLGFDLKNLETQKKLVMDYVHIERSEIQETGEYDLEGLFVRLGFAVDSIGAKRVVLDTIEALFSGLPNEAVLRAELRRLFRWLKDRGLTAVITGEQGERTLTRYGLEEYVADCVIFLNHIVTDQIATRRLRIVKYRGTAHGTNEYPFLIDEEGFSVLPITSLGLHHEACEERVSSGIPRLDAMLGGEGFYRGSSILVSGTAGTGKSSVAAHFADAACRRGERCLYFAFEESPKQIIRNMRSIGIDLEQWVEKGLLRFHAERPSMYGLEMHLLVMQKALMEFAPQVAIIDPISNLVAVGSKQEVKSLLTRLIDFLKVNRITALCTDLTPSSERLEQTDVGISSLMDAWILLQVIEANGERNRGLHILKARGIGHSNQIREFVLSSEGVHLKNVYAGPAGVLTGTARLAQEARDRAEAIAHQDGIQRKEREIERKEILFRAQVEALRAVFEGETEALRQAIRNEQLQESVLASDERRMSRARFADTDKTPKGDKE